MLSPDSIQKGLTEERAREVALAILLWRFWRCDFANKTNPGKIPTPEDMYLTDEALEMAKSIGVKDQFLDVLFKHPVLDIQITNLENERGPRLPKKKTGRGTTDPKEALRGFKVRAKKSKGKHYASKKYGGGDPDRPDGDQGGPGDSPPPDRNGSHPMSQGGVRGGSL